MNYPLLKYPKIQMPFGTEDYTKCLLYMKNKQNIKHGICKLLKYQVYLHIFQSARWNYETNKPEIIQNTIKIYAYLWI